MHGQKVKIKSTIQLSVQKVKEKRWLSEASAFVSGVGRDTIVEMKQIAALNAHSYS